PWRGRHISPPRFLRRSAACAAAPPREYGLCHGARHSWRRSLVTLRPRPGEGALAPVSKDDGKEGYWRSFVAARKRAGKGAKETGRGPTSALCTIARWPRAVPAAPRRYVQKLRAHRETRPGVWQEQC